VGRGISLPRKFFVFFVENTTFWRILTCLFLTSYANGRGSNPPNPLLGTPLPNNESAGVDVARQSTMKLYVEREYASAVWNQCTKLINALMVSLKNKRMATEFTISA